jgi:DNA mismatch endonuclease (patch repair protein)
LRYRVDYPIAPDDRRPIRADVAFPGRRVAVFVDGCYWHGCPEHGRRDGGANAEYWTPKIARNKERDLEQTARLARTGWTVVRLWEHESTDEMVAAVVHALGTATGS